MPTKIEKNKILKTVHAHFDVILDKQEENLYVNMEESKKAVVDELYELKEKIENITI